MWPSPGWNTMRFTHARTLRITSLTRISKQVVFHWTAAGRTSFCNSMHCTCWSDNCERFTAVNVDYLPTFVARYSRKTTARSTQRKVTVAWIIENRRRNEYLNIYESTGSQRRRTVVTINGRLSWVGWWYIIIPSFTQHHNDRLAVTSAFVEKDCHGQFKSGKTQVSKFSPVAVELVYTKHSVKQENSSIWNVRDKEQVTIARRTCKHVLTFMDVAEIAKLHNGDGWVRRRRRQNEMSKSIPCTRIRKNIPAKISWWIILPAENTQK